MGNCIDSSLLYMKTNFPEISLIYENEDYFIWLGRFAVCIHHKDIFVNAAPRLGIKLYKNYPQRFPCVYDMDNWFSQSVHRFSPSPDEDFPEFNGKPTLCVASLLDLDFYLWDSISIKDYIEKFLFSYFISYKSYLETGSYLFGERSHGLKGIEESLPGFFRINSKNDTDLLIDLLRWAVKETHFNEIFKSPHHTNIINKYSESIGRLRKRIGRPYLKRILKDLEAVSNPKKQGGKLEEVRI